MKYLFLTLLLCTQPIWLSAKEAYYCPSFDTQTRKLYKDYIAAHIYKSENRGLDFRYAIEAVKKEIVKDCNDKKFITIAMNKLENYYTNELTSKINFLKKDIINSASYQTNTPLYEELEKTAKLLGKRATDYLSKEEFERINASNNNVQEQREKECTDIDNRKSPLKENIRNQGDIGWCYAFTTADLISHKLGKLVSAIDVAVETNKNKKEHLKLTASKLLYHFGDKTEKIRNLFGIKPPIEKRETERESGRVHGAFELIKRKGVCLEKNARASEFALDQADDYVSTLQQLELSKKDENFNEWLCKNRDWKNIFPNLTNEDMFNVINTSSIEHVVRNATEKACKKRIDISHLKVNEFSATNDRDKDKAISIIDQQLNNGNIIAYDHDTEKLVFPFSRKKTKLNHVNSIVARKYDPKSKTCKYLIRESAGVMNNPYPNYYEKESGHVWVNEYNLRKAMSGVTYVE